MKLRQTKSYLKFNPYPASVENKVSS